MKPQLPRSILLATDFSDCSTPASDYARLLARQLGASLHLLYVAQPPTYVSAEAMLIADQAVAAEVEDARRRMDFAIRGLRAAEVQEPTGEVVVGFAADAIGSATRSGRFDLAVLGTHGRSGLKHLVLGSVAEQVIRQSPIPVVVVRPEPAAR